MGGRKRRYVDVTNARLCSWARNNKGANSCVGVTVICPHLYQEYKGAEIQAHGSECILGSSHGAFNSRLRFFVSPTPHPNSRLLLLHATKSARHTIRNLFIPV